MSDIPEDVRQTGERIWREYHSTRLAPYDLPLEISKAIFAEREWCLSIINQYQGRCLNHRDHAVCMELALLVRSGREE